MTEQADTQYATIYLVRHGETEANAAERMSGHTDTPLTESGVGQAGNLAKELSGINFDAVFSSDLGRAKRTAEILLLERQLAINTKESLREKHFGVWEGQPMMDYRKENQEILARYDSLLEEQKWDFKVHESMESNEQAVSRVITALREIAEAYLGKVVLVVAHGAIMRLFLTKIGYGTSKELGPGAIVNTAYIKLRSDGIDFFIDETKGVNKHV